MLKRPRPTSVTVKQETSVSARWTVMLLAVMIGTAASAPRSSAQTPAAPQSAAAKPIAFEVVSVRKSGADMPGGYGFTADGLDFKGMAPVFLIAMAYHFRDFNRISGFESWLITEHYDVAAKVADGDVAAWSRMNAADKQAAVQALLADRFNLKAHLATKEGKIYELVVAKGGPKFKPAPPVEVDPNAPPHKLSGRMIGDGDSMATLADVLTSRVSRPVVDKTGLSGLYQFRLKMVPDPNASSDPGSSDSLVVQALEDQLGLDLRSSTGPVESLVIDHVERPAEN